MYTASMLGYPPPKITAMKDDKVRERRGREGRQRGTWINLVQMK